MSYYFTVHLRAFYSFTACVLSLPHIEALSMYLQDTLRNAWNEKGQ